MVDSPGKKETDRIFTGMATWYHKAAQMDGAIDPYAALNWIFVRMVEKSRQGKLDSKELALLRESLNKAVQAGKALYKKDPGFWNGVHEIDADLNRMLLDEMSGAEVIDIPGTLGKLRRSYLELVDNFGTSRMMDSVTKQLRFIADNLPKNMEHLRQALKAMATELEG
jgi:hypothetical protein